MKNNIFTPAILFGVFTFTVMSCTANALPKVKNPIYQSYDRSGERGYHVTFEVSHDSIPVSSVVINKIQQLITPENKSGLKYDVNVISQSRKILGFKAKVIDRENGIFFKTDTAEVFKPVDFKLQNN